MSKSYRAGDPIEDFCRVCKTDRLHTVMVADAGRPIRAVCDYCASEHNFRGGPRIATGSTSPIAGRVEARREPATQTGGAPLAMVSERERVTSPMSIDSTQDLELLLRRI